MAFWIIIHYSLNSYILSTFLFYYLKKLITYIQIFFNFEYESKLNMIWNGIPTILLEKKCPIDLSKEETGFIIQLVKCIYSNVRLPNILLNRSISKINFYFLIERQFNGILIFSVMNLIKIDWKLNCSRLKNFAFNQVQIEWLNRAQFRKQTVKNKNVNNRGGGRAAVTFDF